MSFDTSNVIKWRIKGSCLLLVMICRSSSNEVFSPGSIVKDANFGLLSPWLGAAGEITYLHSKEARFLSGAGQKGTFWCGHYPLPSSHFLKGFLAVDPWKFLIFSLNREITSIIIFERRWTPLLFYFLLEAILNNPRYLLHKNIIFSLTLALKSPEFVPQ